MQHVCLQPCIHIQHTQYEQHTFTHILHTTHLHNNTHMTQSHSTYIPTQHTHIHTKHTHTHMLSVERDAADKACTSMFCAAGRLLARQSKED